MPNTGLCRIRLASFELAQTFAFFRARRFGIIGRLSGTTNATPENCVATNRSSTDGGHPCVLPDRTISQEAWPDAVRWYTSLPAAMSVGCCALGYAARRRFEGPAAAGF